MAKRPKKLQAAYNKSMGIVIEVSRETFAGITLWLLPSAHAIIGANRNKSVRPMGKLYDSLTDDLIAFIKAQKMFFVATAPSAGGGHVNLSPKGIDGTFAILGAREIAYLDFPGSGIETIAHIRENGRLTVMMCAFDGAPNILRLYGRGEVIWPDDPAFAQLTPHFSDSARARAIIRLAITRISDSCGYGVPKYEYVRDRTTLQRWTDSQSPQEIKKYIATTNARSIDGLKGSEP